MFKYLLFIPACALLLISVPTWNFSDNYIDVIFLNIPNGEATAIVDYEDQQAILINTGAPSSRDKLLEHLDRLSIKKLDAIFITNKDEEYTGNLEYLVNNYSGVDVYGPSSLNTMDLPNLNQWNDVNKDLEWGDLSFRIVDISARGNISFIAQFGDENVFFLNDGQEDIDNNFIQTVDIDIIKIAEFASGVTPSDQILAVMDPYVSIVFTSKSHQINNDLIKLLNSRWIDVYFVHKTGSIYIRFTKDDYEILSKNQSVFRYEDIYDKKLE